MLPDAPSALFRTNSQRLRLHATLYIAHAIIALTGRLLCPGTAMLSRATRDRYNSPELQRASRARARSCRGIYSRAGLRD